MISAPSTGKSNTCSPSASANAGKHFQNLMKKIRTGAVHKLMLSLKLQDLRKQNHMTQEQLAQCLYVTRAAVSKWETGQRLPNLDSLRAIADLFHVTMDELLA